jgi:hypothetical protein
MLLTFDGHEPEDSYATPFEQWCASVDLHPEDSRAWPLYEARLAAESQTPAAS